MNWQTASVELNKDYSFGEVNDSNILMDLCWIEELIGRGTTELWIGTESKFNDVD